MPDWTFLTRHAIVLSFLAKHPLITAREIADSVDTTERAIRKIIADLYQEGYIAKKKKGRRVLYSINPELGLRHPTHSHISISDLLTALGWKKKEPKKMLHAANAEAVKDDI